MKMIKINKLMLGTLMAFVFLGLLPFQTNAQTKVDGRNVTEVRFGTNGVVRHILRKVGPKTWQHLHHDGKRLYTTLTETGRDQWSVYLKGTVYSSVTINLWKKTVVMIDSRGSYLGKIFASSGSPISTPTPVNTTPKRQTAVNGRNVTEVKFGKTTAVEGVLRKVGPKTWNHLYPDGKRVYTTHTETGRDAWSVYLRGTVYSSAVINLYLKTIEFKTPSGAHYKGKILASSNSPIVRATATKTNTRPPSPLTKNEMAHVMKWISIKTSAARLPFCWRQSKGRTAGKPMVCQAGYKQDTAGLCYKPCGTNEKGIATFCYKNCPAGFRDDGLYCGKPKAYSRGAGYVAWQKARCEKANPQGCVRGGAIWYPKCKAGYRAIGLSCSPICPSGFSDIGVSCKKPNYARSVKPLTRCVNGLQKDGALCYPKCQRDFTGRGPICWQNCPSHQSVNCGAGCATTKGKCASAVFNMTSAPIIAALKIAGLVVTAGGSSAATGGAAAATQGGKIAMQSPKLVKLAQMANKIKALYNTHQTSIKVAAGTYTALTAFQSQVSLFSKEFADNFGEMTTPEIEREIDRRFSKKAAYEIKREWGVNHISMNMEANTITTAKNFISVAGIADPTGLSGVVNAFLNPLCKESTPFPTVRPKY